jgi:integrase
MPHTDKVKAVPSEDEIVKLILAAAPGDEQDIIMCCVHLLGRIDEILRLTWDDINFEKRAVTLWTRKRKDGAFEPDDMPMNDDLYSILKARYGQRKSEKWVFYNEETEDRYYHRPKMMASLCRRAGISPIGTTKRKIDRGKDKGKYKDFPLYYGFHALRHFMASHLIDQEKTGLKSVSKLLRHKNLKTTEIYIHSIDESVRQATTKIEGKFTPKMTNQLQEALQKNGKEI